MDKRVKVGIAGLMIGSVLLLTGCNLKHDEREGTMLNNPSIVEPAQNADIIEESVKNIDAVAEAEVSVDVYSLLENKDYHLNMFPDFEKDTLDSHKYSTFKHNLGVTNMETDFRTGPSLDYKVMETLPADTAVDLIAKCDNGWVLAQRNGSLGFLKGEYVREVNEEAIYDDMRALPELIPVVQAKTDTSIRTESKNDGTEIFTLKRGQSVRMIRKLDNGWYEVIASGGVSFVNGNDVKEAIQVEGDALQLVSLNKDTTVLDVPYGMDMGTINQYEVLKVYGEIEGFYYVEGAGHIGYVPKENCKSLNGTLVVVDVSDQSISLYDGTKLKLETDIVTGKDAVTGMFDYTGKIDGVSSNDLNKIDENVNLGDQIIVKP
ncbi:MAG: hypothetical protein IKQ06_06520 [Bacilli bacterium]|nr:hypothetical protein [Bacilli bacterium]